VRARLAGHGCVAILLVVAAAGCGSQAGGGPVAKKAPQGDEVDLDPAAIARERLARGQPPAPPVKGARPQVVVAVRPGEAAAEEPPPTSSNGRRLSRAEVDAQIRRDLVEFRKYLATIPPSSGDRAEVTPEGQAAVPFDAPPVVATVVQAANEIARTPYRWGGGHGAWRDKGYDCSGSVSFALAAAGLLDAPQTSGGFMKYGAPGPGKWITLYANEGHIFMVVAGIRYDTGGLSSGTRWQAQLRPTAGFVARHPPGL
jgi:cell wall-associated NlpC family hydrolase